MRVTKVFLASVSCRRLRSGPVHQKLCALCRTTSISLTATILTTTWSARCRHCNAQTTSIDDEPNLLYKAEEAEALAVVATVDHQSQSQQQPNAQANTATSDLGGVVMRVSSISAEQAARSHAVGMRTARHYLQPSPVNAMSVPAVHSSARWHGRSSSTSALRQLTS